MTTQEQLEDKTALLFDLIAETVCNELSVFCKREINYVDYLVNKFIHIYNHNTSFKQKFDKDKSKRDLTYMFMRHWLAGKVMQDLKITVPREFGNGQKIN